MKKGLVLLLQITIILVGIGVLAFMLWEPHLEGRNVGATLVEIYFNDPFLACAYIASIPFFVALYQAFKILGYAGQNKTFSQPTARAVRIIKYCADVLVGFVVVGEAYLFLFIRGTDDIVGGVFMGLLMIVIFGVMASAATRFEAKVRKVIDL